MGVGGATLDEVFTSGAGTRATYDLVPIEDVLPKLQDNPAPKRAGRNDPKAENFLVVIHDADSSQSRQAVEKHVASKTTEDLTKKVVYIEEPEQLKKILHEKNPINNFGILDLRRSGLEDLLNKLIEVSTLLRTKISSAYLATTSNITSRLATVLKAPDLDFLKTINRILENSTVSAFIHKLIQFVKDERSSTDLTEIETFESTIYQPENDPNKLFAFVDKILVA